MSFVKSIALSVFVPTDDRKIAATLKGCMIRKRHAKELPHGSRPIRDAAEEEAITAMTAMNMRMIDSMIHGTINPVMIGRVITAASIVVMNTPPMIGENAVVTVEAVRAQWTTLVITLLAPLMAAHLHTIRLKAAIRETVAGHRPRHQPGDAKCQGWLGQLFWGSSAIVSYRSPYVESSVALGEDDSQLQRFITSELAAENPHDADMHLIISEQVRQLLGDMDVDAPASNAGEATERQ